MTLFFSDRWQNACYRWVGIAMMTMTLTTLAAPNQSKPLNTRLAALKSMQADFIERVMNDEGEFIREETGQLALVRPNRFRWESNSPMGRRLIVADGQYVWIYDIPMDQVIIKPIKALSDTNPAALLSGSSDVLKKQFIVEKRVLDKRGEEHFFLRPKVSGSMLKQIELHFSGNTLLGLRMIDNLGQVSELLFSRIRLNQSIHSSLFRFNIPKGVDVIKG